jgi:hypothetical protein
MIKLKTIESLQKRQEKMKEKKESRPNLKKKKIRLNDKIKNKSTIYKRVRDKNYKLKK